MELRDPEGVSVWKDPRRVTNVVAASIWRILTENRELTAYRLQDDPNDSPELNNLLHLYRLVAAAFAGSESAQDAVDYPGVAFEEFRDQFGDLMIGEVARLIDDNPTMITRLMSVVFMVRTTARSDGSRIPMRVTDVCIEIVGCVHTLAGSERSVLVGVRGGRMTFRDISPIAPGEEKRFIKAIPHLTYGHAEDVGPEDAWMVPTPQQWDIKAHADDRGTEYFDTNAEIIRRALENQRYTVNPQGAYVQLNARGIVGLWLKVTPGGGSLMNILARVETGEGSYFMVIHEDIFLRPEVQVVEELNHGSFPAFVICQVYHDLVTATEVKNTRVKGEPGIQGVTQLTDRKVGVTTPVTWTAIPRRVRKGGRQPAGVRTTVPTPTIREPRMVVGHPRVGNMSPEQRTRVVQFETEYGLSVLRFLPEGHTFVLPHMAPKVTAEEMATLPRYVRFKMEEALRAAMTPRIKLPTEK